MKTIKALVFALVLAPAFVVASESVQLDRAPVDPHDEFAGRNILYGPGRWNWDMSLFKNFVIRDQMRFELRAEGFNVFNHPQFGQPNANIGNAQVGVITSTVGNPRQLQMGLRFQF